VPSSSNRAGAAGPDGETTMTSLKTSLIAATALLATLGGEARAQYLDLSGIMMQNMMFDRMMDQFAVDAAQAWYDSVQAYRRATGDYTTPFYSGFNAQTLSQANQGVSQAWDSYNQSWHQNSQAQSDALARYSQYAIRGEQTFQDPWGTSHTLPLGSNHYWIDNSGTTWGTDTYTPPDDHNWYHPLTPVE
jgi:hypothetical protein